MKRLPFLSLLLLLLAGCANQKPATGDKWIPPVSPTPSTPPPAPEKTFADNQMVGIYKAQVSFGPGFPQNKKQLVLKVIGDSYLQLKPKNRFAMGDPNSTYYGIWNTKGQYVYLLVKSRNNQSIEEVKKEMKAKGASQQRLNQLDQPAMFRISDDGSQLMSPTPSSSVVVVLKKMGK